MHSLLKGQWPVGSCEGARLPWEHTGGASHKPRSDDWSKDFAVTADPKRILLVDESDDIRTLVTLLLTDSGHRVTAACTPADAVVRLGREPFDLVICDGFRGPSAETRHGSVDVLRAAGLTPVALFTAYSWEPPEVRAAGYAAFLSKPFDIDDFELSIAQLLHVQPALCA